MGKKILIIAGEVSGDRHAADLVRVLRAERSEWQFVGIGGERMEQAGVQLLYHISQMAFLGFAEVVRHLPFIRRVLRTIRARLREGVDAVILVDYPGFNLRVARMAHALGVPVIYYISPQLWAWGERRVEKMRRHVDLLLVIFRFEVDFYARHGITAHFVGHPMVDQIHISQSEAEFRRRLGIPGDVPVVGLFPGSREMEVRQLLPVMMRAVWQVQERTPCRPVIGAAPHLPEALYRELMPSGMEVPPLVQEPHPLMQYAHAALVASGTATLELGYLQTPSVVLYRVSPLTYWLGRLLIKIDRIAMVNIVLGKKMVPELIQKDLTVPGVAAALEKYLTDPEYYQQVRRELARIREILGPPGASQRAAEYIVQFMDSRA